MLSNDVLPLSLISYQKPVGFSHITAYVSLLMALTKHGGKTANKWHNI